MRDANIHAPGTRRRVRALGFQGSEEPPWGRAVAGVIFPWREERELCRLGLGSKCVDRRESGDQPSGKQHFKGISALKAEHEWKLMTMMDQIQTLQDVPAFSPSEHCELAGSPGSPGTAEGSQVLPAKAFVGRLLAWLEFVSLNSWVWGLDTGRLLWEGLQKLLLQGASRAVHQWVLNDKDSLILGEGEAHHSGLSHLPLTALKK